MLGHATISEVAISSLPEAGGGGSTTEGGPLQAVEGGQIHFVDGVDQGLHPIEQGITA